jgi:HK97 family phage portal protein
MRIKIPFTNFAFNISKNEGQPRGVFTKNGQNSSFLIGGQGIRIAPQDLWRIYRMNADVFSCIREWRQGVGDGGYRFVNPEDPEIETEKNTLQFLESFYRNSGGFNFIKSQAIRDIGISGNAFFEIVPSASGSIYGLKRLDPRSMYVVADSHGTILKYVQRVYGSKDVYFEPHQVWHLVFDDDPDNELLGMSPLETALWEARSDIAAAQSNYYFFENDAVPANLYILDPDLSEDEQKEAMNAINNQFSGSKNRHKSAALGGVKEIKTLSMSQKDMEFVIGRKFNTDKVCSVYGVAKYILGYTESVNYSNGEGILRKFYQSTLQPLEGNYAASTNGQLFEKLGIRERVKLQFLPQTFGEEKEEARFALEEMKSGAITLRQYKVKTGQKVTSEDEQETMIDRHIIHSGASAVLLDDVGVDTVVDPTDPTTAENIVKALQTKVLYDSKND